MELFLPLALLIALNLWMSRRVMNAGERLDKKGLHVAMVWIVPFIGAFVTWVHLLPYERLKKSSPPQVVARSAPLPHEIAVPGAPALALAPLLAPVNGFPLLDWEAFGAWSDGVADPALRIAARLQAERAWLEHLGHALGDHFVLTETEHAFVLSSMEPRVVASAAKYVARARNTISHVLGRLAQFESGRKSVLLVLDDEEWYYHYVGLYYPDEGEFAFSGGMFIDAGCPHFVVTHADLSTLEPVIAHELTHSAVSRLQLPLWLDEGLAVNTERKVAGPMPSLYTPHELRARHLAFWRDEEIQQFWSGESFRRTDDGNLLSYDLARIMVEQMASTWEPFEHFVLAASREDAGAASAALHLNLDLGAFVCALLERPAQTGWAPRLSFA